MRCRGAARHVVWLVLTLGAHATSVALLLAGFPKEHHTGDATHTIDNALHIESHRARIIDRYRPR